MSFEACACFRSTAGVPSLWAVVESITPKIDCVPQTLLKWGTREGWLRDGRTSSERERIKALEREVKERRCANEIAKTLRPKTRLSSLRRPPCSPQIHSGCDAVPSIS